MKFLKLFLLLFVIQTQAQQGGMWIPSLLEGMNEKEMKSLGMKMTAKDIYDTNKSSLKDAVPQFNGGCTSEVISPKGLLLTNHHCGYGQIQSHSSTEHDYLANGFWAYKMEDELPNKDLVVTFIVKIEDVTKQVLEGVNTLSNEAEKQKKIQENIAGLNKSYKREAISQRSLARKQNPNLLRWQSILTFCYRNLQRCSSSRCATHFDWKIWFGYGQLGLA